MDPDKKKILSSLLIPGLLVVIMLLIKLYEVSQHTSLYFLGIYPLHVKGLPGILTSPLIHENWSHIFANSGPLLVLGGIIFYFYRKLAGYILGLIWIITGLWVWTFARDAYHIGASGVVYGLTSFVFTSGLLRKDNRLLSVSLLVVFLYGSLIWGIFPQLFPDKNISWESHLMGLLAGVLVAFYYKGQGPEQKVYEWENDEDEEDLPEWYPEDQPAGEKPNTDTQENQEQQNPYSIKYHYKEGHQKDS
jgi:membrane associated rhomboid family serine protease